MADHTAGTYTTGTVDQITPILDSVFLLTNIGGALSVCPVAAKERF